VSARRRYALGLSALISLAVSGCDSDAGPATKDADADVIDASDATLADTAMAPDVALVDPLPVDPDFDESYPAIGDAVVTTLVETFAPRFGYARYVTELGGLRVPPARFGALEPQPGEPHLLRDQLALPGDLGAGDLVPGALPDGRRSMFYGLVLADVQIVDTDSPAQVAKNAISDAAGFRLPAYRPHGELAAHLADDVVRSAGAFAAPRPFDAALVLGDAVENGQHNELTWFLTVLDGGELTVDSGARDDVVPGANNDAFDPFVAAGLPAGTPWVAVLGNHDFQVNGNFPHGLIAGLYALDAEVQGQVDDVLTALDLTLPEVSTAGHHNAWFPHALRGAFAARPDAWFEPSQLGLDSLADLAPADVPADAEREGMDACGFVAALHEAPGLPTGHGYGDAHVLDCTPWYTWDPVPGLPLRVLALALGPIGTGGDQGVLARPSEAGVLRDDLVGDPRFDQIAFLEAELARADDDDVALIVISHQPSWSLETKTGVAPLRVLGAIDPTVAALLDRWISNPVEPMTATDLRRTLAASGRVIAHLAGHTHENDVRAICPDGTALGADDAGRCGAGDDGAVGYWEATTAAVVDAPHEARLVEIVHVGGSLGALYLTLVDPREPAGSFVTRGRFLSRADDALHGGRGGAGAVGDRNLLLPFALPEDAVPGWTAAVGADQIESESTLLETRPALPPLPEWPEG